MRCMASTVTLITSVQDGVPFGMAASAVTSVSMDPPSLLIAVNRSASIHPVLLATGRFCVNVLGADQADVVAPFSNSARRHERFQGGDWATDEGGLPYLASAPCAVSCTVDARLDYGTHTLFVGQVDRVALGPRQLPLVWLEGAQAGLAPAGRAR